MRRAIASAIVALALAPAAASAGDAFCNRLTLFETAPVQSTAEGGTALRTVRLSFADGPPTCIADSGEPASKAFCGWLAQGNSPGFAGPFAEHILACHHVAWPAEALDGVWQANVRLPLPSKGLMVELGVALDKNDPGPQLIRIVVSPSSVQ